MRQCLRFLRGLAKGSFLRSFAGWHDKEGGGEKVRRRGLEDEEEEDVEGSRFLPHFRPRRWCWYVHAGGICPRGWQCTFCTP